ncbi:AcpP Acyl carrier protein [Burkholderiaceae bacterium]
MEKFLEGLAEVFELETADVTPELSLSTIAWDSLAIVSTIALIDEHFDVMVDGQALASCETVADIQKLIAAAKQA